MAAKKPTDEELLSAFEGIDDNSPTDTSSAAAPAAKSSAKPTPTGADDDDDPFAEFRGKLAAPRTSTSSRPDTPRSSAQQSDVTQLGPGGKQESVLTPSSGSGRSSGEEKAAKLSEEQKILKAPPAPASQSQNQAHERGGGGWWGGLSAMATAAVKQAEAAYKEIQRNEEAQKWAEQMKGNYGMLKGLSGEIRSRALPTFTNILHTLAPPISQHERLQIHITHDFVNYPSLDPMIYQTFSRVMSQVEGGDLLVIQRGSESAHRRTSEAAYVGPGGSSGWQDGPWWRQDDAVRNLGVVNGLVEGTKLARASAEAYAHEFFSARGGVEEAAKQATTILSESNPVRSSDIFLAIQAISHTSRGDLFTHGAQGDKSEKDAIVVDDDDAGANVDEVISFAVYLHDPIHTITFSTVSQAFPQRWADWLDAHSAQPAGNGSATPNLPDEILAIIEAGGVDPREWIVEWIEEILSLSIGVVAQRYVARRMGVGEGGIGRGKRREHVVESGGGEAARAI